jgi:hypothetical protein
VRSRTDGYWYELEELVPVKDVVPEALSTCSFVGLLQSPAPDMPTTVLSHRVYPNLAVN